jgi:hypothetical protein
VLHFCSGQPLHNLSGVDTKLSSELKRLQPDLKKAGIFVEFGQRTNDRRPIRIWRDGQDAAKPTTPERKF